MLYLYLNRVQSYDAHKGAIEAIYGLNDDQSRWVIAENQIVT